MKTPEPRRKSPSAPARGVPVKERNGPLNLISPLQAAERLGLLEDEVVRDPRMTILKMARRGELVAVKVGRCTRIRPESVDDWIEVNT